MLTIPIFSNEFQNICEQSVVNARKLKDESALFYSEAETLLLHTLKLEDFEPEDETYSIKSFKNSFGNTGRIDAEFYQSYYDKFEKKVKS